MLAFLLPANFIRTSNAGEMLLISKSGDILLVLLFVLLPALIATALIRSLYQWWHLRRQSRPESSQPVSVAQSLAQMDTSETLQTLEEQTLMQLRSAKSLYEAGRTQEFVEAISFLIRRYVGDRYDVKVADTSTSQILANLPQSLSEGIVDHVGEILHTCDSLKFARHRPSRNELDRLYQSATEFFQIHAPVALPLEEAADEDADTDETEEELREIFQRYFPR